MSEHEQASRVCTMAMGSTTFNTVTLNTVTVDTELLITMSLSTTTINPGGISIQASETFTKRSHLRSHRVFHMGMVDLFLAKGHGP